MAIKATELSRTSRQWGVEVSVLFTDKGIDVNRTFVFKDEKQIEAEFKGRMDKAILNIQDDIAEKEKPTALDVAVAIEKHFEKNQTLRKADFNRYTSVKAVSAVAEEAR